MAAPILTVIKQTTAIQNNLHQEFVFSKLNIFRHTFYKGFLDADVDFFHREATVQNVKQVNT